MKKLKVGIVGLGFVGQLHIDAIRRLPYAEIIAVADANAELAQNIASRYGIEQCFQDVSEMIQACRPDVIHNCTPNILHKDISIQIIESGIHLFSEKPLARTAEEGQAILDAAAAHPEVITGVNHCYRMNPMVQEIHEMIREGTLGNIRLVHGQYLQDFLTEETDYSWRIDPVVSGPSRCIADIGTHVMDTMQFILGKKITDVCADLVTALPIRKKPLGEVATFSKNANAEYEDIEVKTEDYGAVMFKLEDGTHGLFYVSEISPGHGCGLNIEVDGSLASASWNQEHPNKIQIGYRDQGVLIKDRDPNMLSSRARSYTGLAKGHPEGWNDAEKNTIGKFYQYILSDGKLSGTECEFTTLEEAQYLLKLVEAILESSKSGKWVHIDTMEV